MSSSVSLATARSSLEEMLESIKRRDEKPKDTPPALPARPTLRGRLPSSKRSLPLNFKIDSNGSDWPLKDSEKRDEERAPKGEKDMEFEIGTLGRERTVKVDQLEASPCANMPEMECCEERARDVNGLDSAVASSSMAGWTDDMIGLGDTIGHVLKKDSAKEHSQVQASVFAELESRIEKAEAALRQKEEENVTLQQQLQEYETRWSDYEAKMKSEEEMWQKEVASLQMSLAASKKSLADAPPIHRDHGSESDIFPDAHTPQSTTPEQTCAAGAVMARDSDGNWNAVGHLVKEFEQRTQVFEDDAHSLTRVKSGQSGSSVDPFEEFRKLKLRFTNWKKDYKVRLRKVKATIESNSEGDKTRGKWWGKSRRKK